jgi:hypothetical protein
MLVPEDVKMWLRIGTGYLNLATIVDIHFPRDSDGMLTATLETLTGHVKHYKGREAARLQEALDGLAGADPAGGCWKPTLDEARRLAQGVATVPCG